MPLIRNGLALDGVTFGGNALSAVLYSGTEVWSSGVDSELDFTLTSNLTQPLYLTQSAANAVTVDWGDGSSTESPSDLTASLSHTYAAAGDYTVSIACASGETWSPGVAITSVDSTTNYGLCGQGGVNATYPTLTGVRSGTGMRLDVSYAFCNCSSLTSVTIPDSVTRIGSYAFYGCSSLTSVTIPEGVASIENSVFLGCASLTSVTIPDSVTSIGDYAFVSCSSLVSVAIPAGVTSIGIWAFVGCRSLTDVILQNGLTTIGSRAFNECTSLASVMIPDSVTSIGGFVFSGCTGLTSVTIGNGMTSIGNGVFNNCSSLTSVTSLATTPPVLGTNVFYRIPATCPIYVPSASIATYQAANGWSDRAAYIQAIPA